VTAPGSRDVGAQTGAALRGSSPEAGSEIGQGEPGFAGDRAILLQRAKARSMTVKSTFIVTLSLTA
jgi:hypothetical protein